MIKTKLKKLKPMQIVCIALVTVLSITGVIAYIISGDSTENVFTVGKVKVELTEPNWKPDYDSDGDGVNDTLKNIIPSQEIAKDPTLTNTGNNDAFVYLMIEIPKAYSVDLHTLTGEKINKPFHPLFSFSPEQGWKLVDSQIASEDNYYENEAYDYYLYGYNQPLKKDESVTLFDKVTFANITSEYADLFNILGLKIKVKGYAIQSDFYGTEKIDATKAWQKFVNQNGWSWPHEDLEKVVGLKYVDENKELIYAEALKPNEEIELYFDSSLARNGYTFDWVDISTGEVANNGMTMPDSNVTLMANYTSTGYGSDTTDYITYDVKKDTDGSYYLSVTGLDETHPNYPTEPTTIIIPSAVTFTVPYSTSTASLMSFFNEETIEDTTEETIKDGIVSVNDSLGLIKGKQYTLPVKTTSNNVFKNHKDIIEILILSDNINSISLGLNNSKVLRQVELPYALKSIPSQCFSGCSNLLSIKIGNNTTKIGSNAFLNCTNLFSISIPDSIVSIGNRTFQGCTNLRQVYVNSLNQWCSIYMEGGYLANPLYYATELYVNNVLQNDIKIPETVNEISSHAFYGFKGLKSLCIPNSVTKINNNAFANCSNMTDVYYKGTIEDWCKISFSNSSSNPMNCAENFYINNELITEIAIPDTVTEIKEYAFLNFDQIERIILPKSITKIGVAAFSMCDGLMSATIPDSVTLIDDRTFSNCLNLSSVTIPNSVTEIGTSAFDGCASLESIIIPDSVTSIGDYALSRCSKLSSISLGNNVSLVNEYAFYNSTKISSVFYSGDIDSWCNITFEGQFSTPFGYAIGTDFYINNTLVTEVTIPNTVNQINSYTFYGIGSIKTIIIPKTLSEVSKTSFDYCSNFKYIVYEGTEEDWEQIKGVSYIKYKTVFFETQTLEYKTLDGITYAIGGKSAAVISYSGNNSDLIIPNIINDKPILSIAKEAFYKNKTLISVTLPNSIVSIDHWAFDQCENLLHITIPSTIKKIDLQAFYLCNNIVNVYYAGTAEEWNNIFIAGGNDTIASATIHYNS